MIHYRFSSQVRWSRLTQLERRFVHSHKQPLHAAFIVHYQRVIGKTRKFDSVRAAFEYFIICSIKNESLIGE